MLADLQSFIIKNNAQKDIFEYGDFTRNISQIFIKKRYSFIEIICACQHFILISQIVVVVTFDEIVSRVEHNKGGK